MNHIRSILPTRLPNGRVFQIRAGKDNEERLHDSPDTRFTSYTWGYEW